MGDSILTYIEKMEVMIFFSGYPLVYLLIHFLAGVKVKQPRPFLLKLTRLLPIAYALLGVLFLGFELRKMYPDYSPSHFYKAIFSSLLKIWGLISILFFFPIFQRKSIWSFLHSLLFIFLLIKDILLQQFGSMGNEMLGNDMGIYSTSLLLNTVILMLLFFYIWIKAKFYQED